MAVAGELCESDAAELCVADLSLGALVPGAADAPEVGEAAGPAVAGLAVAADAAPPAAALPGAVPLDGVPEGGACAAASELHTAIQAAITQLAVRLIRSPPPSALVMSQTGLPLRRFTETTVSRLIVHLGMDAQPTAARAIHLEEITADTGAETLSSARELLLEYGQFVIAHPESAGFCYGTLEKEAARLPLSYLEKQGGCLVARVDNEPAGFVAWRAVPTTVALDAWELKRLWVRPLARGLNLGRILTQAVIARASKAYRKAVYLDTAPAVMSPAHRLYLSMGFEPCPCYNDNPVKELAWMVKHL